MRIASIAASLALAADLTASSFTTPSLAASDNPVTTTAPAQRHAGCRQRIAGMRAVPLDQGQQRAVESAHKRGPLRVGGRLWSYTSWVYDLSPDARYVYFSTLRRVGDPIRFPGSRAGAGGTAAGSDAHSAQECPYCEISTAEIGDDLCPQCGRQLVYEHYA